MKSFAERLREDRRLVMLRLLAEQPRYQLNSSNLHAGLHHLAVACTRDDVLTDVAWLAEQGLIAMQELPEVPGLVVCTLLARGHDVATGSARVPGVSQPHPR
jgi:hypothetical protein